MPLNPPNVVRTPEGYRPAQSGGPSGPCCFPFGVDSFDLITPELPLSDNLILPGWNLDTTDTISIQTLSGGPGTPIVTIDGPVVIVASIGLIPGSVTVPLLITPDGPQSFPATYQFLVLKACGCAGFVGFLTLFPNVGGGENGGVIQT